MGIWIGIGEDENPPVVFPSPNPEQPVVKVWRRTETGEAPRWQGAMTENIGNI